MSNHNAKAAEWKRKIIEKLVSLIKSYKIIALADMTGMPSVQLQSMRNSLRGKIEVIMAKGNFIALALDKSGVEGAVELKEKIKGMPAIVLTNDNPFKLAKTLAKSKSSAPAKAGQVAPKDIEIKEGPTPFAPGPIIGEMSSLGIPSGIDGGKVVVKKSKVVVKEGEVIKAGMAQILTRLGIHPMEIGINLTAALENGTIFEANTLRIDEDEYKNNIVKLAGEAFNLAFNIGYPTKENIKLMLMKAVKDAEALVDEQDILIGANVGKKLSQAEVDAKSVSDKVGSLPEGETPKVEEKEEVETPKEEEEEVETPKVEEKEEVKTPKEEVVENQIVEKEQENKVAEAEAETPVENKVEPVDNKIEPEVKDETPKEEAVEKKEEEVNVENQIVEDVDETPKVEEKEEVVEEEKEEPKIEKEDSFMEKVEFQEQVRTAQDILTDLQNKKIMEGRT